MIIGFVNDTGKLAETSFVSRLRVSYTRNNLLRHEFVVLVIFASQRIRNAVQRLIKYLSYNNIRILLEHLTRAHRVIIVF